MKGKSSRHHDREVQLHLYASWALVVLICTLHHATPYMCTTSHYPYYVNYSRHGCPSVRLYIRPYMIGMMPLPHFIRGVGFPLHVAHASERA